MPPDNLLSKRANIVQGVLGLKTDMFSRFAAALMWASIFKNASFPLYFGRGLSIKTTHMNIIFIFTLLGDVFI